MKKRLLRYAASIVLGLSLTTGAAAAHDAVIDTTGPDSDNTVEFRNETDVDVDNNNKLKVGNSTNQNATSGDADVRRNTSGGDAESGDTRNENEFEARLSVSNSGWACDCLGGGSDASARIENTGPDSDNHITVKNEVDVDVDNNNYLKVYNHTNQNATSGDAQVVRNTTGGDATTGHASNANSSSVVFEVSN